MKSLWNSFKIAFAMFSKIPMPQAEWTEENMRYMLCFFPFVGAAAGLLTLGVSWLGEYFGFGTGFMAMALILVPVLVTGGIHVDGLLDTSDALSSWRDREKRLEILKDSHAGAFAVITACVYFLVLYGGFSQITGDWTAMKLIALGYVVSRCFSGLGVITLPKANAGGTVAEFSRKAQDTTVRNTLIVYLVLLAALMLLIQPVWGAVTFVTAVLVSLFYKHKAMKYFGGTTGDLSGYFLCLCEAWMVLALAILLCFSKSKQLKTVGRIGLIPAFFNISEPIIFGVPLMLNPVFFIPFLMTSTVNGIISFLLVSGGVIGKSFAMLSWNMPSVFGAFLSTMDIKAAILIIVLVILDMVIYFPFFKIYEKSLVKMETGEEE